LPKLITVLPKPPWNVLVLLVGLDALGLLPVMPFKGEDGYVCEGIDSNYWRSSPLYFLITSVK
jgi:hypothetical protein